MNPQTREEAAEKIAKRYVSLSGPEITRLQMSWDFKNGFLAGTEWQNKQLLDAVEEMMNGMNIWLDRKSLSKNPVTKYEICALLLKANAMMKEINNDRK